MSSKASSAPALRPLPNTGTLVRTALAIYRAHFFVLLGYAGWMLVPLLAHTVIRVTFGSGAVTDAVLVVLSACALAIGTWSYAHIVRIGAAIHEGRQLSDAGPDVRSRLLPVFLALMLYVVFVLFGAILVIPGIFFAVWFAFAPIIVTLEGARVLQAFTRSRELVRGRFWRMLQRLFTLDVAFLIAYLVLVVVLYRLQGFDFAHMDPSVPMPVSMDLILSACEILAMPLLAVYRTVLYLEVKKG